MKPTALPLLLTLLLPASGAWAEVLDRVVVVVEDSLIFASQVAAEERLARMDSSPSPFWDHQRADAVTRLTEAAILRQRAQGLGIYDASPDEIDQRLELLRARFPNRIAWQRWLDGLSVDEDGLRRVLSRRILVERYLRRNLPATDPDTWQRDFTQALAAWREGLHVRVVPPRGEGG